MKSFTKLLALVLLGGSIPLVVAQSDSSAIFEGCAMPLEGNQNYLTLCEPHSCSLLRGEVSLKWAGHTVKLRGVLQQPASNKPRTINVLGAVEVGKACNTSCQPAIAGRGLGSKDKPDGEGATPGVKPKPDNPPSQ